MNRLSKLKLTIPCVVLDAVSLGYLYLPVCIFFISWTKWYIAAAVAAASVYGCLGILRSPATASVSRRDTVEIGLLPFFVVAALLLFIGLVAGWGAFMPQAGDWSKHNVVLSDLVLRSWPVYYRDAAEPSMLTYYIGHYLVPALFGKLFGSFRAAELMFYCWSELGVFLIVFQLFRVCRASRAWQQLALTVVFLLFSGCLVLSQSLMRRLTGNSLGNSHWMVFQNDLLLQYRSNYVCLRWVAPQCVAVWLIVTMWWSRRQDVRFDIPLMLPALLNGALSFLGLAIMAMLCALSETLLEQRSFTALLRDAFSLPNLSSLLTFGAALLLYYSGNVFSEKPDSLGLFVQHPGFLLYFIFCMGEFGLYSLLCLRRQRKNGIFLSAVLLLLVLPFFRLGWYNDLVMCASIPAMFAIMICVITELLSRPVSWVGAALCVLLLIGSWYPVQEANQVLLSRRNQFPFRYTVLVTLAHLEGIAEQRDALAWKYNYFSYNVEDNLFIRYLARTPWE